MTDYLFLTLSVLLMAGCFAMSRLYQQREGTELTVGFRYTCLLGALTALIFFALCQFHVTVAPFSILMASSVSALVILYTLVGFRLMKTGGLTLYTMFLMAGGMIVPYVWGLVFWKEELSWLRTLGLCILLGALILANYNGKGQKLKLSQLWMCLAVFFLNGFTSVCSKLHQIEDTLPTVSSHEFVFWSGLTKCILAGVAWLICAKVSKKQTSSASSQESRLWVIPVIILVAASLDGISYMFQLSSASRLPATVLYPFVTGGSTILSALVGMICFGEKPTRNIVISLILCFVGTLLFL